MKQLREECPELFSDAELNHTGPKIDPHEMEIDMNTNSLNPEQALTIARALAEGSPWTNVAPPAASLGEHAPGCAEHARWERRQSAQRVRPDGDPEEGASCTSTAL